MPNKAPALTKEHNINSLCYVSMKVKTLVYAGILEFHSEGSDVLPFKSLNIWIQICPFGEGRPL